MIADEQIKRVEQRFLAKYNGSADYGKPIILPPGTKYTPLHPNCRCDLTIKEPIDDLKELVEIASS